MVEPRAILEISGMLDRSHENFKTLMNAHKALRKAYLAHVDAPCSCSECTAINEVAKWPRKRRKAQA